METGDSRRVRQGARVSRGRRVVKYSVFTMLAVCLVLGILEVAIRVSGIASLETTGSPLPFQAIGLPPTAPGHTPDSLIYMPSDNTTGKRRTITSAARKTGYRVLTFGGSATYGWGFNPLVSFSGRLQAGLVGLEPPVPVEVLNMGACGWNSSQVAAFLEPAIEAADPDLVVIYSGNNEFIDIQALKIAARVYSAETEYLRRRFSRSHLYRLLRMALTPPPPPVIPSQGIPIDQGLDTPITDEDREVAAWVYRRNLRAMVAVARAHHVNILLTTVADNQRDFCSHDCKIDDDATRQWLEALERLGEQGTQTELLHRLDTPPVDTAREAVQFRLGQILLQAGLPAKARQHFLEAERLTLAPQRCTEPLRKVVRQVAREFDAPLCDLAALLSQEAPHGIPGREMFIDDCHPNADAHRRLARHLLTCLIDQDLLPGTWQPSQNLEKARRRLDTTRRPGCRTRLDTWDVMAMASDQLPSAIGSWCTRLEAAHHAFTAGKFELAVTYYNAARDAGAPAGPVALDLGLVFQYAGDITRARRTLEEAEAAMPHDPDVANYRAVLGGP